jgi:hypothetical protein
VKQKIKPSLFTTLTPLLCDADGIDSRPAMGAVLLRVWTLDMLIPDLGQGKRGWTGVGTSVVLRYELRCRGLRAISFDCGGR